MGLITLSFDNGPGESTESVLATLDRFNILATFFLIGSRLDSARLSLAADAHDRGHWIGNHTWSHSAPLGTVQVPGVARSEIERTQDVIGYLAHEDRLFRPVGGGSGGIISRDLLNAEALETIVADQLTMVLWNAVPRDWEDPHGWLDVALRQISKIPHSVVVLHDRENGAMDHLGEFIERALERGSDFAQGFPTEVTPIVRGVIQESVDSYVA